MPPRIPLIECIRGDITTLSVDALVNAANSELRGGGGVDGAIHRAGGPAIMQDCDLIREQKGGCPTGEAVLTTAGLLPAKAVIHTVGPVWKGGERGEKDLLRSCYINSLRMAETNNFSSMAFPNISTGVYGFPKYSAAKIALETVRSFQFQHVRHVVFVCFDEENFRIYSNLLGK